MRLPTGQAAAEALGVAALTPGELAGGEPADVQDALKAGGFLERTPLWFYVLKEASVQGGGNTFGSVGSRNVAETIVGLLLGDPTSYLHDDPPWEPEQGVHLDGGRPIRTIRDLLAFSELPT